MTDRELMRMALRFFDWFYSNDHSVGREDFRATQQALRERLSHPEREWVGLTDEDIKEINTEPYWDSVIIDTEGIGDLARQIEAKLKEKNT